MTASLIARAFLLTLLPLVAGCIPYTVGTTAQTVPEGERVPSVVWYTIPNGLERHYGRDSTAVAFQGIDIDGRIGVSNRADVGIRIPAMSGIVLSYKYRLTPGRSHRAAAVAAMGGMGIVNFGNHLYFEGTMLASGRPATFTPYGGLRISQVAPLSRYAPSDSPTAGGFLGMRIGKEYMGVSVEVGVYYDRSALGIRDENYIIVPAIVVHGSELIRLISGR